MRKKIKIKKVFVLAPVAGHGGLGGALALTLSGLKKSGTFYRKNSPKIPYR